MAGSARPQVRVVIVTLDNHLAGAASRAAAKLADDGITIGFHAASDWDRDPAALDRAREDIASGDIVIATMLFLDDHIRAVLPALTERRDECDAMLGLMSGSEIVKLTRMGTYRMDAPARGPMALLKRLRGSRKPGASSGAGQMKMLRRLPKLLRFIPGSAHIEELDTACEGLNIPRTTESAPVRVVLNNSSGFGGANVCVVMKAVG